MHHHLKPHFTSNYKSFGIILWQLWSVFGGHWIQNRHTLNVEDGRFYDKSEQGTILRWVQPPIDYRQCLYCRHLSIYASNFVDLLDFEKQLKTAKVSQKDDKNSKNVNFITGCIVLSIKWQFHDKTMNLCNWGTKPKYSDTSILTHMKFKVLVKHCWWLFSGKRLIQPG